MFRKIILPTILLLLTYGFWISPNFKEISAGVAIFLFGMLFLEEGFKAFTGGLLERLLRKTTNSTLKSIGFGIVSTTIMQSSSLVSVITISFLGFFQDMIIIVTFGHDTAGQTVKPLIQTFIPGQRHIG